MNLIKSIFKYSKFAIFIILLTIVVIFCVNNSYNVVLSLNPLPYEIEIKLFLLPLIFFLAGILTALTTLSKSLISGKIGNLVNKRKVQKLQKRS